MNHQLPMSPKDIEIYLRETVGEAVEDFKIEEIEKGLEENPIDILWFTVEREEFRNAVEALADLQTPHLSVASGSDKGDFLELIYHFHVNYGYPGEEVSVNMKVHLPKDDPIIPTITDIVPGALTTEREKQEFLGVDVKNIPDSRRLWLQDDFPEDRYPWRWDEEGMEDMSKYVHSEEDETFDKPIAKYPRKREIEAKKKREEYMEDQKKKEEEQEKEGGD